MPSSAMPTSASPTQTRWRGLRERTAASASGPMNSIATAGPSGMSAIDAKKKPFMPAIATPNSSTCIHCRRDQPRMRGRATSSSTPAASSSRSVVTPQLPSSGNSCMASAAPNCRDTHDARIIATAGSVPWERVLARDPSGVSAIAVGGVAGLVMAQLSSRHGSLV
ncbi:hypothetical protein ACFPRL_16885 [Pseudoclavibacter helvolus]